MKIFEMLKEALQPLQVPVVFEPDAEIEAANRFWAEARSRVLAIAEAHGLQVVLADHGDEFLFALYDGGERVPSEAEVIEAIREYMEVC